LLIQFATRNLQHGVNGTTGYHCGILLHRIKAEEIPVLYYSCHDNVVMVS
jgi:hypothetical protein